MENMEELIVHKVTLIKSLRRPDIFKQDSANRVLDRNNSARR